MTPAAIDCPLGPEPRGGMLVPADVTDRIVRALNGEAVPEPEPHTLSFEIPAGTDRVFFNGVEVPLSDAERLALKQARVVELERENAALRSERDALVKGQRDWRETR